MKLTLTTSRVIAPLIGLVALVLAHASHAQLGVPMPLSPPSAVAPPKAGPSLEETTQWITAKLNATKLQESRHDGGTVFNEKNGVLFDQCDALFYTHHFNNLQSSRRSLELVVQYVPLHLLDAHSVQVKRVQPSTGQYSHRNSWLNLVGSTKGNRKIIVIEGGAVALVPDPSNHVLPPERSLEILAQLKQGKAIFAQPTWWPRNQVAGFGLSFHEDDGDIVHRAVDAFKHAISLCVEKANREQPSKPKELF
jgi:hypothetical protein